MTEVRTASGSSPSLSTLPRTRTRIRTQLAVFALAYGVISVGFWIAAAIVGGSVQEPPAIWYFGLGASGPSLAALVAVVILGRGTLPRRRLRAPWIWLPAAVVLGALPAVVSALVIDPAAFGAQAPEVIAGMGGLVPFIVMFLLAGPLAEEFGWRGYAQPRLRMRFGWLATAAILGTAWAAWHVPFFFLDGTGQQAMGLWTPRAALFLITMLPLSVVYLFVTEHLAGGVMAAIVLHFVGNATGTLLPQTDVAAGLIQLGVVTLLAVGALAIRRFSHAHDQRSRRAQGQP